MKFPFVFYGFILFYQLSKLHVLIKQNITYLRLLISPN